ncbi:hypothetical protein J8N05_18510 [Streptomyces sp. BH-SS-21]|uniref:Uncharacterized protein n=1 Tax=Streptomyces liliiviolaceus TaxID=2823109 RepID=A0A940XYU2_9ACTN|nr:hypothetical protein [Streptomyces liliiviolaceus]MBQ0850192.1 hypothetical protein [Streptomyces liliiviolaceus]
MPRPARTSRTHRAHRPLVPGRLDDDLAEHTAAEVWDRRVRDAVRELLSSYRPHEELTQTKLTRPFIIPSDDK